MFEKNLYFNKITISVKNGMVLFKIYGVFQTFEIIYVYYRSVYYVIILSFIDHISDRRENTRYLRI